MVYKKYIKRGKRMYGPYIYKSRRDGGRVITEYVGKHVDEEKGKTIAVFLNPIRATQLMEICEKRKVLPHKSTYFYPKIPAGLLIHQFGAVSK